MNVDLVTSVRIAHIAEVTESWYAEKARADRLHALVMKLGDRILTCAQILGHLAEKRTDMARGRKPAPKLPEGVADEKAGYVPPEPAGMGKRAVAKWRVIVPLIAQQVALKEVDADALRQYCEAAVLREKAVAELEDAPLLCEGPNGAQYGNPLMKIISQQESLMMKLAERFGLDPASRRRLQIEAVKADSAFAEFLKSGRTRPKPAVETS